MNKLTQRAVCALVAACMALLPISASAAQPAPAPVACARPDGVVFGFFNGVRTSPDEAAVALRFLTLEYGEHTAAGEPIRYDLFYNETSGIADFVETFSQRLAEHDSLLAGRYELFWQSLRGDGPLLATIQHAVTAAGQVFHGIGQDAQAWVTQALTSWIANPPTQLTYAEQKSRIDGLAVEGKKMVFFAHSQGNLFVNAAYDYAVAKVGSAAVKVVHVAPASPRLIGAHTLADLDLVIWLLRATGGVASVTDSIPDFAVRPPGVNGKRDAMGHGLLEVYLNHSVATSTRLRGAVETAFETVQQPPALGSAGFITATLTWDGAGDVDLHVDEPNSSHVYFASPRSVTGELDVDDIDGYGPEHYTVSCDPARIQTGIYRFAIANYYRADGRVASLQIASANSGVLGTVTATLGAPTLTVPSVHMLSVSVTQDPATGEFRAAMAP